MTLREYLKSIADKIRYHLSMSEGEKINAQAFTSYIDNIAETKWESGNMSGYDEGYHTGYSGGYNEGYNEGEAGGIEKGKQAEYDAFWDTYQRNGNGFSYYYTFCGPGWKDSIYNPKYPIRVLYNANYMYFNSAITNTKVSIDICELTGNNTYMFGNSKIETIPLLIVNENTAYSSTMFESCSALENLTVSGVIASKGFNLKWSTLLTRDSIVSVIDALSTTTSGLTVTFSATAVNNAFDGGSEGSEWLNLIATKPNWTISLV